jgi:endonuclease III
MGKPASASIVEEYGRDPFLILISCLLSLRTRDTVSLPASQRLFEYAKTPHELIKLSPSTIQKIIYPVGFYRVKAANLIKVSHQLINDFSGKVPATEEALLTLAGVGRKTANLVLAEGFQIPALCVDTHVHRISNRLGLVSTQTPAETEEALKQLLPKRYWAEVNNLLVMWGQNVCVPISPLCSGCALLPLCPQRGVTRHR